MNKVLLRSRVTVLFRGVCFTNSVSLIRLSPVASHLLKSRGLRAMPLLLVCLTSNRLISECAQRAFSLLVMTITQYPFFMLLFHTISQNVIFKSCFCFQLCVFGLAVLQQCARTLCKNFGKGLVWKNEDWVWRAMGVILLQFVYAHMAFV